MRLYKDLTPQQLQKARKQLAKLEQERYTELVEYTSQQPSLSCDWFQPKKDVIFNYVAVARKVYGQPSMIADTLMGSTASHITGCSCCDARPIAQSTMTIEQLEDAVSFDRLGTEAPVKGYATLNRAEGKYIIGRIVSKPFRNNYVVFALEDRVGNVVLVKVAYWPIGQVPTGDELDTIFPRGQEILIKEPLDVSEKNWVGITIESPTDLVMLSPSHPLLRDIEWTTRPELRAPRYDAEWNTFGQEAVDKGQHRGAIKLYSTGIQLIGALSSPTQEQLHKLLLLHFNRSCAHLDVGHIRQAHSDCQRAINLLRVLPKDKVRADVAAIAWVGRGWIEECARNFELALSTYEGTETALSAYKLDGNAKSDLNADLQKRIKRVKMLIAQSRTGQDYDWQDLYRQGLDLKNDPSPVVADYKGPYEVIESFAERAGRRAVLATRDIEIGEPILVEKATCTAYYDLEHDPSKADDWKRPEILLDAAFVEKILDVPSLMEAYESLYHEGPDPPRKVPATYAPDLTSPIEPSNDFALDIIRTQSISRSNSTRVPPIRFDLSAMDEKPVTVITGNRLAAMYPRLSSFNHSCLPNTCLPSRFGDVAVLRARCRIAKGEEITRIYGPDPTIGNASRRIFKSLIEEGDRPPCSCVFCKYEDEHGEVLTPLLQFGKLGFAMLFGSMNHQAWWKQIQAVDRMYPEAFDGIQLEVAAPLSTYAIFTAVLATKGGKESYRNRLSPLQIAKRALTAIDAVVDFVHGEGSSRPTSNALDLHSTWREDDTLAIRSVGVSNDLSVRNFIAAAIAASKTEGVSYQEAVQWRDIAKQSVEIVLGPKDLKQTELFDLLALVDPDCRALGEFKKLYKE